jgi:hypothetical protein
MTGIIKPGARLLFMKVGTHANEALEDIVRRKTREIEEAGFALWGYGGNTCHPVSMVQPFAEAYEKKGGTIYLCMHPMVSRHFAITKRATEFSIDGRNWQQIPQSINVVGSRYALAIRELQSEDFDLPLSQSRVAIGTSMGRRGSTYVSGHVDKACLEITPRQEGDLAEESTVHIGLIAKLVAPFAVFVRNAISSQESAEPISEPS